MTFEAEAQCNTWSCTIHGRGKRAHLVGSGVYVVEHLPTGKCITGISKTVSADVDKHIQKLLDGTHPNKKFVKLVSMDRDLRLLEYPSTGMSAKQILARIRSTCYPKYLLLN
jgi:hypothetical protein